MPLFTRRAFCLGLVPATVLANRLSGRGAKIDSEAVRFADALTERTVWRLTDPAALHHLPHYHHRFISKRRSFLLLASDRTGTRQIYRMNLPDGDMVQLTTGEGIHSYSPTLDPRDRSCFLLQGDALKEISVGRGREKTVYRCPRGWLFTGHLSLSSDGAYAAVVEVRSEDWTDSFEEQFQRRPRCRIRVVDTARGGDHIAVEERNWLAHPQFRPNAKEILYRHEGPWEQVEDRLWLTSLDGKQKVNLRPRQGDEQIGHEYWRGGGSHVCYVHHPDASRRGATVRCFDVSSRQERVISRCTQFGWLTANEDHSAIVGASRSLAGPNIYVLFTSLKREITICEHASSGKPYPIAGTNFQDPFAAWPEPVFSADSRWVYFTSDKDGQPAVYRANVSDLVEST